MISEQEARKIRNDALEEAARMADAHASWWDIAEAIRALKHPEQPKGADRP